MEYPELVQHYITYGTYNLGAVLARQSFAQYHKICVKNEQVDIIKIHLFIQQELLLLRPLDLKVDRLYFACLYYLFKS
jgi:hypothetical protein